MSTFLGLAAKFILDKHHLNELQHLKIIFPSKRASLYFKNEIAALSAVPFFSPSIQSIDDFIQESSGYSAIDPIDLYFEIYYVWKRQDANQSFEKFLTWVPTLVKDFDLIDLSMIKNPHALFKYMSEAEALNRWGVEEHELSDSSSSYFTFFDRMSITYENLKKELEIKNMSYTGMAYRHVAENLQTLINSDFAHFYFVGLNALSVAEEVIIEALIKAGKATCVWDSDGFYMNSKNKAGKKLRFYKERGKFGKEWNFQEDLLLNTHKEINVFELSSTVLQAKIATDIALKTNSHDHAMIVLDESDFTSLFVQLPSLDLKYNVSAGISFKASSLSSVFDIFLELLDYTDSTVRVDVLNVLIGNTLIERVLKNEIGDEAFRALQHKIKQLSYMFISRQEFYQQNSKIFIHILEIKDIRSFLSGLDAFLIMLSGLGHEESAFANVIIEKLQLLKKRINSELSVDAFKILIKELLKNISLPFEKVDSARLQVMSMLETRCLDFEELTFVSFLEGNLPSGKKNNSFIPFDAARDFKLPLYSDQDAIMSYHFLRLLQRAKKVNILYAKDSGSGIGKKEKSSFIRQIEEELVLINRKIVINYPEIQYITDNTIEVSESIRVNKTPDVISKIHEFLTIRGLSPTAINEYFKSRLGFYWQYIERIRNKEDSGTDIGSDVFGSMLHYVLEKTDEPYFKSKTFITSEILENQKKFALENFNILIEANQPKFDFKYGLNSILKTVAKELLGKYYDKRLREFTEPFKIVGLESKYEYLFSINGMDVKIKGTIDKLELHGDTLIIIDYKTGAVDSKKIEFDSEKERRTLQEFLEDKANDKFRQLFIYNFLINNQFDDIANFKYKFYSFRNLDSDLILQVKNHTNHDMLEAVNIMIKNIVSDLIDATRPFEMADDEKMENYSDFYELLS